MIWDEPASWEEDSSPQVPVEAVIWAKLDGNKRSPGKYHAWRNGAATCPAAKGGSPKLRGHRKTSLVPHRACKDCSDHLQGRTMKTGIRLPANRYAGGRGAPLIRLGLTGATP